MDSWSKQSQTKPILPATPFGGLAKKGNSLYQFCFQRSDFAEASPDSSDFASVFAGASSFAAATEDKTPD